MDLGLEVEGSSGNFSGERVVSVGATAEEVEAKSLKTAGVRRRRSGGCGLKAIDGVITNWGFGGKKIAPSMKIVRDEETFLIN